MSNKFDYGFCLICQSKMEMVVNFSHPGCSQCSFCFDLSNRPSYSKIIDLKEICFVYVDSDHRIFIRIMDISNNSLIMNWTDYPCASVDDFVDYCTDNNRLNMIMAFT